MSNTVSKVWVLDTSPRGSIGSMRRYADLLMSALSAVEFVEPKHIYLALPNKVVSFLPRKLRSVVSHLWIMVMTGLLSISCKDVDIFHIPDGSHAYIAKYFKHKTLIVTVHDIIPALITAGRLKSLRKPGIFGRLIGESSKTALNWTARIISDSESTRKDLTSCFGIDDNKITVVYPALPGKFFGLKGTGSVSIPRGKLTDPETSYVLTVGNNAFYKNRKTVIDVFREVRKNIQIKLVIAGETPDNDLIEYVRKAGLASDVKYTIDPSDDELMGLYGNARLFIFPSTYEGFGWPPLEAMACGCPVVCSNAASLPEVVGNAARIARANDTNGLAEQCLKILQDDDLASETIKRGYAHIKKFSFGGFVAGISGVYSQIVPEIGSDTLPETVVKSSNPI